MYNSFFQEGREGEDSIAGLRGRSKVLLHGQLSTLIYCQQGMSIGIGTGTVKASNFVRGH
jgi:hypothetical protein